MGESAAKYLICRAGGVQCAIPAASVTETMRMLPLERGLAGDPCVLGTAVIRGNAVPVVSLACLLNVQDASPARLVTVRAGESLVAIAVSEVVGLASLDEGGWQHASALSTGIGNEVLDRVAVLDGSFVALLRESRLRVGSQGERA